MRIRTTAQAVTAQVRTIAPALRIKNQAAAQATQVQATQAQATQAQVTQVQATQVQATQALVTAVQAAQALVRFQEAMLQTMH